MSKPVTSKDLARFIAMVGGPVGFVRLRTAFSLTGKQARKLIRRARKKGLVVVRGGKDDR